MRVETVLNFVESGSAELLRSSFLLQAPRGWASFGNKRAAAAARLANLQTVSETCMMAIVS